MALEGPVHISNRTTFSLLDTQQSGKQKNCKNTCEKCQLKDEIFDFKMSIIVFKL